MRTYVWLLTAAGLAACSDDGGDGEAGGAGGGGTTSAVTTAATSIATTAQSGAGGEGGGVPKAPNGAPCTEAAACDGGICLREDVTGHPGGLCTSPCDPDDPTSCDGHCEAHDLFGNICFLDCLGDLSVCRDAYACKGWPYPPTSAFDPPQSGYRCVPACMDAADCPITGVCTNGSCHLLEEMDCQDDSDDDFDGDIDCYDADCDGAAACSTMAEVCDNGADDDWDGDADCEAATCAAACETLEAQLCAAAPALAASHSDSTAPGPGIGGGSCVPYQSAGTVSPRVYRYQAPSDGTLTLTLTSVLPHVIRMVDGCELTATTTLECAYDSDVDGHFELTQQVVAGAEYTIMVFAAAPAHVGAFTLTSELQ